MHGDFGVLFKNETSALIFTAINELRLVKLMALERS